MIQCYLGWYLLPLHTGIAAVARAPPRPPPAPPRCPATRGQGIEGHGFYGKCVVPVIENTARECELTDRLRQAIADYPQANAVLVRRHGACGGGVRGEGGAQGRGGLDAAQGQGRGLSMGLGRGKEGEAPFARIHRRDQERGSLIGCGEPGARGGLAGACRDARLNVPASLRRAGVRTRGSLVNCYRSMALRKAVPVSSIELSDPGTITEVTAKATDCGGSELPNAVHASAAPDGVMYGTPTTPCGPFP